MLRLNESATPGAVVPAQTVTQLSVDLCSKISQTKANGGSAFEEERQMESTVQCGTLWDRNSFRFVFHDTGLQLDFPQFNVLLKPELFVFVYLDQPCKSRTEI